MRTFQHCMHWYTNHIGKQHSILVLPVQYKTPINGMRMINHNIKQIGFNWYFMVQSACYGKSTKTMAIYSKKAVQ